MIRSNPLPANWRASSSPIPLDAPVTNASCCMRHHFLVGVVSVSPTTTTPADNGGTICPTRPMPRPGGAAMAEGWLDAVTDATIWGRVPADRPRPDLEPQGAATHGFSVPHTLLPGQQVEAWALGCARTAPATVAVNGDEADPDHAGRPI